MAALSLRKFTSTRDLRNSKRQFEVEEILQKRLFDEDNQVQYKVKWKNYDYRHCTWEPAENLISCWDLLQEFEEKLQESMAKSSSDTRATARKSSPTGKKRSASPARTSSASRKSAPTTSAAVKSKRPSSRSRNRSPARKVLEPRISSKKKSPSPSPKRKSSPSKAKSPKKQQSKSPLRLQKPIRSSPKNNSHVEPKIHSTMISGSNASATSAASKSKTSTTNSSSNGMSFCQMVDATKTKGISLLSDLFSPKSNNKQQPQTQTKSSSCNIFSKIANFCRPKRKIVRGSFFAASSSPATKHRSSSCIFSRSALNFTNLFYLLFFCSLIFTLYLCYVNLHVLSKRMQEFNSYVQDRFDEVSDQMLTMYDEWKYGDNH